MASTGDIRQSCLLPAHTSRPVFPHCQYGSPGWRPQFLGILYLMNFFPVVQVANVTLTPRILPAAFAPGKSLALEMLRTGNGTIYEQVGFVLSLK